MRSGREIVIFLICCEMVVIGSEGLSVAVSGVSVSVSGSKRGENGMHKVVVVSSRRVDARHVMLG
jgi:hypothetical protein